MSAQDNVHDFKPRPDYKKEIRRIAGMDSAAERDMAMHDLKDDLKKIGRNCTIESIRADVDAVIKALRDAKQAEQRKAAGLGGASFECDDDGRIIACMANAVTLLDTHPDVRDMFYWDDFGNRPMVMHPIGKPQQHALLVYGDETKREFPRWFSDNDYLQLLEWVQHQHGFQFIRLDVLKQAVDLRMKQVRRNPVIEWLESLKWDGKRRVELALMKYFGARRERYSLLVSKVLFLSIVARIMWPGCKQDFALAFIGGQGVFKSWAARVLAIKEEYFVDCLPDLSSRDAMVMMEGKIIGELAEHAAANKRDAAEAKGSLSRRFNQYVQKYEKWAQAVARTITLLSTTNEDQFLADQTGNRRWGPIDVCVTREKIDIEGLKADLPQIYAEAYARLKKGERYWPTPEEQRLYFEPEQDKRRIEPNWEATFREYMRRVDGLVGVTNVLDTPNIGVSTAAFALFFDNCERFKPVPATQWRNALKRMGWECKRHRVGGQGDKQTRLWARKGSKDVLDCTISWEPKCEFSPGKWRRDALAAGCDGKLSEDAYDYEKMRLEREMAELEAKKPNRPNFAGVV